VKVEVVRSARRRRTVQARVVNGVLRVSIPATMNAADEQRWVDEMIDRVQRRSAAEAINLDQRAERLARRFDLRRPTAIRWADNQQWRWGSCTPGDSTVRISSRLAKEPGWVLDYVIVHELAHLHVPRHDRAFWALANRYPLTERARGFLIARGLEPPSDGPDAAGSPAAGSPAAWGRPAKPKRVPAATDGYEQLSLDHADRRGN
jgi:predicted metal-dependent hydrolase